MEIKIKNDIEIFDPTYNVLKWVKENLVVSNPTYVTLKRIGKEDLIGFQVIIDEYPNLTGTALMMLQIYVQL